MKVVKSFSVKCEGIEAIRLLQDRDIVVAKAKSGTVLTIDGDTQYGGYHFSFGHELTEEEVAEIENYWLKTQDSEFRLDYLGRSRDMSYTHESWDFGVEEDKVTFDFLLAKEEWLEVEASTQSGRKFAWSDGTLTGDFGPNGSVSFWEGFKEFVLSRDGKTEYCEAISDPDIRSLPWSAWQRKQLVQLDWDELDEVVEKLGGGDVVSDEKLFAALNGDKTGLMIEHFPSWMRGKLRQLPKSKFKRCISNLCRNFKVQNIFGIPRKKDDRFDVTSWEFRCAMKGRDPNKLRIVACESVVSKKGTTGFRVIEMYGRARREKFYLERTLPQSARQFLSRRSAA